MLSILLIDDDPTEYRLIQRMLKSCYAEKFILRYADTIKKAKSILENNIIDVVLLDDKLNHGLRAKDTVPALRQTIQNVPLVVISSVIDAAYLKDKTILNVYDIVDKFKLQDKIHQGLLADL